MACLGWRLAVRFAHMYCVQASSAVLSMVQEEEPLFERGLSGTVALEVLRPVCWTAPDEVAARG